MVTQEEAFPDAYYNPECFYADRAQVDYELSGKFHSKFPIVTTSDGNSYVVPGFVPMKDGYFYRESLHHPWFGHVDVCPIKAKRTQKEIQSGAYFLGTWSILRFWL